MIAIDLSGRTALVTGGGRGLGRAISLVLARAGARVAVNYLRNEAAALETVDAIERAGGEALALQADVSHDRDVEHMLATVAERFGGAHIFVSNAALGVFREPGAFELRGVRRTFEISAWPLLDIAGRLAGFFRVEGYGRVVAVSSAGARRAVPGYAALGMAKGALEAAIPYVCDHLAACGDNVTANAVVPTGFHDQPPGHLVHAGLAQRLAEVEARTPGGRYPTMSEVADAVLFLASDLSRGISGQSIVVDRGWSVA